MAISETLTRRSFLTMAGCAGVALAVPSSVLATAEPLKQTVLGTLYERLISAPTYAQFMSDANSPVGPLYEIPVDWWRQTSTGVALADALTVHSWPLTCTVQGVQLVRSNGERILMSDLELSPPNLMCGDSVSLAAMRIDEDYSGEDEDFSYEDFSDEDYGDEDDD